jgi:hypothetical protein
MATVLDEILAWAKTRPLWQQDALRRLVTSGHVDDEAIRTYADAAGERSPNLKPLSEAHLRTNGAENKPVSLVAIRGGKNVNALMDGETLSFAPEGLTIVYGDNGSGKSGYARVLKAVTRTRASETVRSDTRRCSFCGKHRHQVTGLATTVDNPCGKLASDAAICTECLILCGEIHAEQLA